jgi:YqaJ-like viral recombinase domain
MPVLYECQQGSADWHALRVGVCTASVFVEARSKVGALTDQQAHYVRARQQGMGEADACVSAGYKRPPSSDTVTAALQGLPVGTWGAPAVRLAKRLAIERICGHSLDGKFQTWQMARGQREEPVARAAYEALTGYVVLESGIVLSDDGRVGYSTDGRVAGQPGGIEIKTPSSPELVVDAWLDIDAVLSEYRDQCLGGMWLQPDWQWIDLVIYTPWLESIDKQVRVHRIHRDQDAIDELESDIYKFLAYSQSLEYRLRGQPAPGLYQGEAPPWEDQKPITVRPAEAPPVAAIRPAAKPATNMAAERLATTLDLSF